MITSLNLSIIAGMKIFDTYYGGKGSNGTFQTIINLIPPCKLLVIPFLGNCAILRNIKLPPDVIAIDKDASVIKLWKSKSNLSGVNFINGDGVLFLKSLLVLIDKPDTVIYCDPPYLISTRKSIREVYKFEMYLEDHQDLLSSLIQLRSRVLISAIQNDIYDSILVGWNKIKFLNKTRHGMQEETVYFNFENTGQQLQDYRYIGNNFRQREIIKRKFNRWMKKINSLPPLQKNAFLDKIKNS